MGLHWKGPTREGHVLSIISRSKIIYFLLHLSNGYVHWYILHDRSNTLSYFFEISQFFEQTSKNNNEDDTFNNNQYLWRSIYYMPLTLPVYHEKKIYFFMVTTIFDYFVKQWKEFIIENSIELEIHRYDKEKEKR